jgi:hypothetical protein
MRQADNTIKGFFYQFNKTALEILSSDAEVTIEGAIEDIDIESINSNTTIQCNYHEEQSFKISSIISPILEMLCHFGESRSVGKDMNYILYAYFGKNNRNITIDELKLHLNTLKDKEVIVKYFPSIYNIEDNKIIKLANQERKTVEDKKKIIDYFIGKRDFLQYQVDIETFWAHFQYIQAEKLDELQQQVVEKLIILSDEETARTLYYPNLLTKINEISSEKDISKRKITKQTIVAWLREQKSVLATKLAIEVLGKDKVLKEKREYLASLFEGNSHIRAFVFSALFVDNNRSDILPFILHYLDKYNCKPKLHKPPIFIFDIRENDVNSIIRELYNYKINVNCGIVGGHFLPGEFVNNTTCSPDFKCKITVENNITNEILKDCNVSQLYRIGKGKNEYENECFQAELLEIGNVFELKYLTKLSKKWSD